MKKLSILLLIFTMFFSLAACNDKQNVDNKQEEQTQQQNSNNPNDDEDSQQEEQSDEQLPDTPNTPPESSGEDKTDSSSTKTLALFREYLSTGSYTMETKTDYEGISSTSLSVYDDEKIYTKTESETDGAVSISILMDDSVYILNPSSKLCMKMSAELSGIQEMFSAEEKNYESATNSGETNINGKTYFYEEFSVDGESVKYCFDGDSLKYIILDMNGSDYITEILRMEKGADKSLFEIPSDYTMMEI